jgi:hypothetical protein
MQIKIVFCALNTIQNILKHHTQTDKYVNAAVAASVK